MLYRYPDVLEPQVKFFRTHALSDPRTRSGLQQKIRDVVKGEMPHCQNVLISLLQELQAPAMSQPDTPLDILTPSPITPNQDLGWGIPKRPMKGMPAKSHK